MRRLSWLVILTALLVSATPRASSAQNEISATGKGMVGGGLLGAEVIMLTEAAFGLKSSWAYAAGGLVGAGAGGYGGYLIESSQSAKTSVFLLAGALALVIPTTVAVLSVTAYDSPADQTADSGPRDEHSGEPALTDPTVAPESARLSRRRPKKSTRPALPPALVDVDTLGSALSLSVPAVSVRDSFSPEELARMNAIGRAQGRHDVAQSTRVDVPVLNNLF